MDMIEDFLMALSIRRMNNPIARISLAPWSLFLLRTSGFEIYYIGFGAMTQEEIGLQPLDGAYLRTPVGLIAVDIDPEQGGAYRIWDRSGVEVICYSGRVFGTDTDDVIH